MAYLTAAQVYARQNKVINMAFSRVGMPYSANKETWQALFKELTGRDVDGLSSLTLAERHKLIKHFNGKDGFKGKSKLFNPIVSKHHQDWMKGEPETLPENVARPLMVSKAKFRDISKIGAILADMKLPWAYVDGIAKKRYKTEIVEWCTVVQIRAITQMMAVFQRRQE